MEPVVKDNAPIMDTMQAFGRYLVLVVTAVPVLLKLLGEHNLLGMVDYFRSTDGGAVIAAMVGLGTMAFGLFKTHKRGTQAVGAPK